MNPRNKLRRRNELPDVPGREEGGIFVDAEAYCRRALWQGRAVLLITDGYCEEQLSIDFEHAFLMPEGKRLPFTPRGEVFWVR